MLSAHIGLKNAYRYDRKAEQVYGSSIQIDADTIDFTAEIQRTPHFTDTFKWWTGPWMQKVPYYRPLTISAFWAEYQVFGKNGRLGFQWTHRLWHLAFLTLLLVFLTHISDIKRATLSTAIFALGWNTWLNLPTGTDAFNCWKDQCDVWSIITTTAACLSLWRWLESRKLHKNANQWWKEAGWWRTFAFFVLGLTIKETGLLAPLYLALTLWLAGRLYRNWFCLLPFLIGNFLWVGLRTWALNGWGHKTGAGGAWLVRFESQVLGFPSAIMVGDGLTVFALGIVVGLVLLWLWRHDMKNQTLHIALGIWLLIMPVSAWQGIRYLPEVDIASNFSRLLQLGIWQGAAYFGIMMAGFGIMIWQLHKGEKLSTFGWLWVVISFLPFVLQPPTSSHVHYPLASGWSLWIVICTLPLLEPTLRKIKARINF